MNSIVNYGSDDDCDDSSEDKPMDSYTSGRNYRRPWVTKQDDANYDEVQMSLSEDSSDESRPPGRDPQQQRRQSRDESGANHRDPGRRWDVRDGPRSRPEESRPPRDRPERREERAYGSKGEPEENRSKDSGRDEDRNRERYRPEKEDERLRDRRDERRGKSRERYNRDNRDDRYRDRKDRDRRRSRSPRDRDRRRSRSPRRDRSRSRSRDRSSRGSYPKRYERGNKERFERPSDQQKTEEKPENKDRFFVPGITGRFREQIEKRKLLWQKKEPETQQQPVMGAQTALAGGSRTTKVWEATTFAQDTDGKVANKFKRLMGIKNVAEGSNAATDVLKKQEEMFSSMEQQYEVARTATHTMRGVGLGFGSYQR